MSQWMNKIGVAVLAITLAASVDAQVAQSFKYDVDTNKGVPTTSATETSQTNLGESI